MCDSDSICFICLHHNISLEKVIISDAQNGNTVTEVKYVVPELAILLDPEIPAYICRSCLATLHSFYLFKKKCLENYTRLMRNTKIYNTAPMIPQKPNTMETEKHETQKPESRKTFAEDKIVIKEEVVAPEDSADRQYYHQQLEFVKCEAVSDQEQDGGSSSEDENRLKDETPMDCQEDLLSHCTSRGQSLDLLPEKTKKKYEIAYNTFIEWRQENNITSFSEDTLLTYFKELTKKYKSSTLWTLYSMLKNTLSIKHNIEIEPYARVRALLKRHAEGYQPKKSEAFTGEEISKFINEAPDVKYLATKVALIMGVMGACRANELYAMKIQDFKFFEGCIQVFVPRSKTRVPRNFTITDNFYQLVKRYADLRPTNAPSSSFFFNYQKGKCTNQIIGINKFGTMGKEIAKFLNLPNPERYTGHCLRRSSGTLYFDGGNTMTALKRHRVNKMDVPRKIFIQIDPDPVDNTCASTSDTNSCTSTSVNNNT